MTRKITKQWRMAKLSDVAEINPRSFSKPANETDIVSFVPMKAVEGESGKLSAETTKSWDEVRKGYTPFQDGDVIFAKITPCMENGKYALAKGLHGGRAAGSTEFHVFRPKADLDAAFLLQFLFSDTVRRDARMNMRGAAGQLRVPTTFFEELEIPVPPIDEQRRIVAEIEKQFTRLDAGVAALRRVQANLKRYRAAVLKAACEGRLVPTEATLARVEGRTFETGAQLLQRILADRRKNWTGRGKYEEPIPVGRANLQTLPEGWSWTALDSLIREPLRNGHSAKATTASTGLRVFTLSAVTDGDFSEANTKLSVATAEKVADLWAEPGDIYVERSNTPELVGIARLYKGPSRFAFIPDLFIRVRVGALVSQRFIELCLLSERGRTFFRSRAQGISGTMPKIDQETVALAPIPFPPLAEQERIVAEVERRLSVIDELESAVTANLARATRLRQSVLQRAFAG